MSSSNLPEPLDDVEIQLRQKLDAVLMAPLQSAQRAKAMSRLLGIIQHLPGIKLVAHHDYLLALNQTWEWVSRNIDEFQISTDSLEQDLVKWVNGYLYWRIYDIYHPNGDRQEHLSLDISILGGSETYLDFLSDVGFVSVNLNTLNEYVDSLQREEDRSIASQIEVWIESDPEGLLKNCYPRDAVKSNVQNRNHCHCQILSYRIIVKDPPDSFTEIAKDLDIPYQTLVAHWKRKCLPILQAQTKIFGYEK
jgi:hypothetical protein